MAEINYTFVKRLIFLWINTGYRNFVVSWDIPSGEMDAN